MGYIAEWDLSIPVAYTLIVMLSFAGSVVAYDVAIRRTRIARFLFSMKTSKKTPVVPVPSPPFSPILRDKVGACRAQQDE